MEAKVPSIFVANIDIFLPTLEKEVGVVSEINVFSCDTAIDLEYTMLVEAKGWADCVWDPAISSTN